MIVVGYYTPGAYEREADLLRASLEAAGMKYELTGVGDRGGWYANTAFKAEFLRDARDRIHGPMVYVDVDAFVHQNCTGYFNTLGLRRVDFGAHWFAGPAKGYDKTQVRRDARGRLVGWWMLSGTLYFGDRPGARELLRTWCDLNALWRDRGVHEGGGQKNLWYAVSCMTDLRIERIPGRYCYVFDKPWGYPDGEPCIIEHTIASRDHRARERQTLPRAERKAQLRRKVGLAA